MPGAAPWKVAREIVALDHLSDGRLILGVGLGFSGAAEFEQFGEVGEARTRADKLDEALDIIAGLCTGEPYAYTGQHYQILENTFTPRPVQDQIPFWIAGNWPNRRPFRRAARWDGVCPAEADVTDGGLTILPTEPATVRAILDYISQHRHETGPYDVVISRTLPADKKEAVDLTNELADAGVTWLLTDLLPWEVPFVEAQKLIRNGPPL